MKTILLTPTFYKVLADASQLYLPRVQIPITILRLAALAQEIGILKMAATHR